MEPMQPRQPFIRRESLRALLPASTCAPGLTATPRAFLLVAALIASGAHASQVAPPPPAAQPPSAPVAPGPNDKVVPIKESYPDDPRLAIVQRLLGGGNFEYAKNVLEQILKEHPNLARAEFFLGVALVKLKKYEQGRPHLERSIQLDQAFPERKHAHHFMGWASYYLGEADRARSDFETHLKANPDEPDSIFALGLIAFDSDDLDEAERLFQRSIDLQQGPNASKRDVAKAWIRMGDLSMRRDDAAKAEERYMAGLALFANHYEGWAKLARARDRLGKAAEAESARNEERRARARIAGIDPDAPIVKPESEDGAPAGTTTPTQPPPPASGEPAKPPVTPPASDPKP
jgi:uncharacterized protein HemY